MERKRILFIIPTLSGGGAEKVLIDILKNFNQEKFLVTLIILVVSYLDTIQKTCQHRFINF